MMKRLILTGFIAVTACSGAQVQMSDAGSFYLNDVLYQIRTVDAGSGLVPYKGELITGEHNEVEIGGSWYECHGSCVNTVRSVLAQQQAAAAAAAAAAEEEADRGDGGSGGGGY